MSSILYYIVVAIVGLAISPFIRALVERYSREEKIFVKDFAKEVKFDTRISLSVPISFIMILFHYGLGFNFVLNCFIALLLIISFFVDLKAQIIPNETNFIGFIVGIAICYYELTQNYAVGLDKLFGMLAGAGIFILIALFALLVYRRVGMGMGDVKLMGVLGLFFGFANTIQIFVFSFFIGAIISIFLLITKIKKKDDYIPFGPFIVIAAFITMFLPATTTLSLILSHMV